MKSRFIDLAGPIALTIILGLSLFFLAGGLEGLEDVTRKDRRIGWERIARMASVVFRDGYSFEGQVVRMNNEFKRAIGRLMAVRKPGWEPSAGNDFQTTLERVFPASHRSPGFEFHWFTLSGSGKTRPLPMLTGGPISGKARLLGSLLEGFLNWDNLSEDERKSMDQRSGMLFGGPYRTHYAAMMFVGPQKGRCIRVFNGDKRGFLIWDTVPGLDPSTGRKGERLCYMGIFPTTGEVSRAFLDFGLKTTREAIARMERVSGYSFARPFEVLLVPSMKESDRFLISTPDFRRFLELHTPYVPLASRKIPTDTLVELDDLGLWAFRIHVAGHFPYDLWIVSRAGGRAGPGGKVFKLLLSLGIPLLLFRKVTRAGRREGFPKHSPAAPAREGFSIPIRLWFSVFLFFAGILPLLALAIGGVSFVESSAMQDQELGIKEARQRLEEIDSSVELVTAGFRREGSALSSDPGWCAGITGTEARRLEAVAGAAFRRFGKRGFPLSAIYVLPADKPAFEIRRGSPGKCHAFRMFDSFFPLFESTTRFLEPGRSFFLPIRLEGMETLMNFTFLSNYRCDVREILLAIRRKLDQIEVNDQSTFFFQDLVTENGKSRAWVYLRADFEVRFVRFLRKMLAWEGLRKMGGIFLAGRCVAGGIEPVFPRADEGKTWESSWGRKARFFMDLSSRTRTGFSVSLSPDLTLFLHPCQTLKGFVLATLLDSSQVGAKRASRLAGLLALVLLFLLLLVPLGMGVFHHLLFPLIKVEEGLARVTSGDLSIRVALPGSDELGELTRSIDGMIQGLRERKRLTMFVPGTIGSDLAVLSGSDVPEPSRRDASVLVSDIRQFTSLSERHLPNEVVDMLNEHFEAMVGRIRANGGTVDRFIGDAVVAVFFDDPDRGSPVKALRAAIEMMRSHIAIRKARVARGDFPYRIGIGIDTGTIEMGTIKAKNRFEQTILGDVPINAESLEAVSKLGTATRIIVSDRVRDFHPGLSFISIPDTPGYELAELEEI